MCARQFKYKTYKCDSGGKSATAENLLVQRKNSIKILFYCQYQPQLEKKTAFDGFHFLSQNNKSLFKACDENIMIFKQKNCNIRKLMYY